MTSAASPAEPLPTGQGPAVALLGTGTLGAAMVKALRDARLPVRVWDRTARRAEALRGLGAEACASPALAVEGAGVVMTVLADGEVTEEVVTPLLPAFGTGVPWVQLATIGLQATTELAGRAAAAGVEYVDAPVSGTKEPAEKGELIVLAAGAAGVRDRCRPVFDAIGKRTVWLGEQPGDASRMKLVVNCWMLGLVAALGETLSLAEHLGVSAEAFFDIVEGGPLDSPALRARGRQMVEHRYASSFPLDMATKDARLLLEAADGVDLPLPVTAAVLELLEAAAGHGFGRSDLAAVHQGLPHPIS